MKPLIYIVDDDESVRESLRLVLEISGYRVDAFVDGADLATRAAFEHCRCMILDVHLPGESGIEILARLRLRQVAVPVIVTTGQATGDIRRCAEHLQVAAFFDKPIDGAHLLAALARVVRPGAMREIT